MDMIELPHMQLNKNAMESFEARAGQLIEQAPIVLSSVNIYNASAAMEFVASMKAHVDEVKRSDLGMAAKVFFKAHRGITDLMNRFTKPFDDDKVDGWIQKIQRRVFQVKQEEETRLLREADAVRKLLEKQAEEQKLNAAIELEKSNPVLAEAILNSPVSPAVVPPAKVQIANTVTQERWKARVVDKLAFIKLAAERHDYLAYLEIDEAELSRLVTKLKGKATIAGVECWRDDIVKNKSAGMRVA